MGKMGSICHFPGALSASICWHCAHILVFTSIWGTHKRAGQWHFSCCFSQHLGTLRPPNTAKTRENAKWQIDPVLPSHRYSLKSRCFCGAQLAVAGQQPASTIAYTCFPFSDVPWAAAFQQSVCECNATHVMMMQWRLPQEGRRNVNHVFSSSRLVCTDWAWSQKFRGGEKETERERERESERERDIYIYIYICRTGARGDRVFSKNGAVRGPPYKGGSGTAPFRTIKIGISEEKCGNSKKGQKSQIPPPPLSQELSFAETHTWICARGTWPRNLFDRVLPL